MASQHKVIIFGATSAIAQAIARRLAGDGAGFALVGRDEGRLAVVRDDLLARGATNVTTHVLSYGDYAVYAPLIDAATSALGGLTTVIVAHGELSDQERAELEPEYLVQQLNVNLISPLVAITVAANRLQEQGSGMIIVPGSVAGDRGRRSNYAYGTAKAALATFSEGLRSRLAGSGVQVMLVKPGRVDTPMTAHFPNRTLFSSPDRVARDVVRAMSRGRDVVYTPWYWRYIMLVIRLLPAALFKRARF